MYFKVVRFNSPSNFRSIYDATEKPIIYTVGEIVKSDTPMFIYKFGESMDEYRHDRYLLQIEPYNVEEVSNYNLCNTIYEYMSPSILNEYWRSIKISPIFYPKLTSNKFFVKKVYSEEEAKEIVEASKKISEMIDESLFKIRKGKYDNY